MLKLTLIASGGFSHGDWATSNALAEKTGITVEVVGTDGYVIETFRPPLAVETPAPVPVVEVPTPVFTPVFTPPESAEQTNG